MPNSCSCVKTFVLLYLILRVFPEKEEIVATNKVRFWFTVGENFEPVGEAKRNVRLDLVIREKCNSHYEEHEQVWSQIRNCRNEEGEFLDDLVTVVLCKGRKLNGVVSSPAPFTTE